MGKVTFVCVASGVPPPTFTWMRNGTAALVTGGTVVGLATVTLLLSVLLGG